MNFFKLFNSGKLIESSLGDGEIIFNKTPEKDDAVDVGMAEEVSGDKEEKLSEEVNAKIIEIFNKYGIKETDNLNEKTGKLIEQLTHEIAINKNEIWKDIQGKTKTDLIANQELMSNLERVENYFISQLGNEAGFQEGETVRKWLLRVIKIIINSTNR